MSAEMYSQIVRVFFGESEFSLVHGQTAVAEWWEIAHFDGNNGSDCERFSTLETALDALDALTFQIGRSAVGYVNDPLVKGFEVVSGWCATRSRKHRNGWIATPAEETSWRE